MKLFKSLAAGITAMALMAVPTMSAYAVQESESPSPSPTQTTESPSPSPSPTQATESPSNSDNSKTTTVEAKEFTGFFDKVTTQPGNSYKDAQNHRFFVKDGESARFSVSQDDLKDASQGDQQGDQQDASQSASQDDSKSASQGDQQGIQQGDSKSTLTTHIDKVISGDNGVQSYQAVLPIDENGTPVYSLDAGEYKAYQTEGEPSSSVDVASIANIPSFEVKTDGTAPEVVDNQSQDVKDGTQSVDKGYSLSSSRFAFNDADSGVNANSVTVKAAKDGSTEQSWAFGTPFDAGMYSVSVQVADNVGNISQPYTFNLKVSDTASAYNAVTLKSGDGVYFQNEKPYKDAQVFVKPGARLEVSVASGYSIDFNGQNNLTGDAVLNIPTNGADSLPVVIKSDDGSTTAQFVVSLDDVAPTIDMSTVESQHFGAEYAFRRDAIKVTDGKSGIPANASESVKISVDGSEVSGDTVTLSQGVHNVDVSAKDNLGNASSMSKTVTVVDKASFSSKVEQSVDTSYYKGADGVIWYNGQTPLKIQVADGYSVYKKQEADGQFAKVTDNVVSVADADSGEVYIGSDAFDGHQTEDTLHKLTFKKDADAPTREGGQPGIEDILVPGYIEKNGVYKNGATLKKQSDLGYSDKNGVGLNFDASYISINNKTQIPLKGAATQVLPEGYNTVNIVFMDYLGNTAKSTYNLRVSSDSKMSVSGVFDQKDGFVSTGQVLYRKSDGAYPTFTYMVQSDSGLKNATANTDVIKVTSDGNTVHVEFLKDGSASFTVTNNFGASEVVQVCGDTVQGSGEWSSVKTAQGFTKDNVSVEGKNSYSNGGKRWYANKKAFTQGINITLVDSPSTNAPIDVSRTAELGIFVNGQHVKGKLIDGASKTIGLADDAELADGTDYTVSVEVYDMLGQKTKLSDLGSSVYHIDSEAPQAVSENIKSIFANENATIVQGQAGYYAEASNVSLKSVEELKALVTDTESGVNRVEVYSNGSQVSTFASGENKVDVKAFDNVGNGRDIYTFALTIGEDKVDTSTFSAGLQTDKSKVQAYDGNLYYNLENGRPVFTVKFARPATGIKGITLSSNLEVVGSVDYATATEVTVKNIADGEMTIALVNNLGVSSDTYTIKGDDWSGVKTVDLNKFSVEENQGSGDLGTPFKKDNIWYYQSLHGDSGRSFEGLFGYSVSTGEGNLPLGSEGNGVTATINGTAAGVKVEGGKVQYADDKVAEPENNTKLVLTVKLIDTLGNSKEFTAQGDYRVDSNAPAFTETDKTALLKNILQKSDYVYVAPSKDAIYIREDENAVKSSLLNLASDSDSGIRAVKLFTDGKEPANAGEESNVSGSLPDGESTLGIVAFDNVGNKTVVDFGKIVVTMDTISSDDVSGTPVAGRKYYSSNGNLFYNVSEGLPEFRMSLTKKPASGIGKIESAEAEVIDINKEESSFTLRAKGDGKLSVNITNGLGVTTTVEISGKNSHISGVMGDNTWESVKTPTGEVGEVGVNATPKGSIFATGRQAEDAVRFEFSLKEGENAPVDPESTEVLINGKEVASKISGESGDTWKSAKLLTGDIADDDHVFNGQIRIHDVVGNVFPPKGIDGVAFYVDNKSPDITGIKVSGGSTSNPDKPGKYTQIFNTEGTYTITADDGSEEWSSGINTIHYKLVNSDGSTVEEKTVSTADAGNTAVKGAKSIEVKTPNHFRGYLTDVYAVDNVGNQGQKGIDSEGIITEGVTIDGDQGIGIDLPGTPYHDASGNPLYSGDVKIGVKSRMSWSGFRDAGVSVNGKELSHWSSNAFSQFIDSVFGVITGDVRGEATYGAEGNNQQIVATATDKAGKTVTTDMLNGRKALFSIDKTAPKISVTWNDTNPDNLYGKPRVATVTISDVNVSTDGSVVKATDGDFSGWKKVSDTEIQGTITFGRDTQNAELIVDSADLANNKAEQYHSEKFFIDTTKPVLSVTSSGNPKNGKYYNTNRVFTVRVTDKNFDPKGIKVEGGQVGGWGQAGDVWTTDVTTNGEGEHQVTISAVDKVNNMSDQYQSDKYIQDTIKPEITINGITNGASYSSDTIQYNTGVSDENIDGKVSYSAIVSNSGKESVVGGKQGIPEGTKSVNYGDIQIGKGQDHDGYYQIKVHAEDLAGNISDKVISFTVNRYGGQYDYLTKDYNGKYLHEVGDISLSEVSYDRLDPSKAKIIVTRNGLQMDVPSQDISIKESRAGDDKPWQYDYSVSGAVFKDDGVYRIQVFSFTTSGRGNTSASIDYTFIIDNTSPSVAIEGINSGEDIYSSKSIPVSIITRDEYGLSEGSYSTSQGDSGIINNGTAVTSISAGRNITVATKAVDMAGNNNQFAVTGINVYGSRIQRYSPYMLGALVMVSVAVGGVMYGRRSRNDKLLSRIK